VISNKSKRAEINKEKLEEREKIKERNGK